MPRTVGGGSIMKSCNNRAFGSTLARIIFLVSSVGLLSFSNKAYSQALVGSEQFQELFASAGYSALFGAALGTAILPFMPDNSVSNLRVVAGGASIGFVLGSAMALYGLRQQQQQQTYGMQYNPEGEAGHLEGGDWRWDVGTSNGKDVFLRMDSRF